MANTPQKSREDIVRGQLTDSAITLGQLYKLETEAVIRILKEVADDLTKDV